MVMQWKVAQIETLAILRKSTDVSIFCGPVAAATLAELTPRVRVSKP